MRRSLCPSVKRVKLLEQEPVSNCINEDESAKSVEPHGVELKIPDENLNARSNSMKEHLDTISDLQKKNFDKIAQLKSLLNTYKDLNDSSEAQAENPDLLPQTSSELKPDEERKKENKPDAIERLKEEFNNLQNTEKDLDSELKLTEKSKETKNSTHMNKLHTYNDLKDACQTIFGRLAELDQVTVKEIYEQYDLALTD